jgi:hypothetical protein
MFERGPIAAALFIHAGVRGRSAQRDETFFSLYEGEKVETTIKIKPC